MYLIAMTESANAMIAWAATFTIDRKKLNISIGHPPGTSCITPKPNECRLVEPIMRGPLIFLRHVQLAFSTIWWGPTKRAIGSL